MQDERINVVALRNEISHHGSHAGYDQLFNFLQRNNSLNIYNISRKKSTLLSTFLKLALLYPFRWYYGNRFFTLDNYIANANAEKLAYKTHAHIVHFLYWEDCYSSPFNFFKNTTSKLIATTHQPVSWWQKNVKKLGDIKRLDALIVLSVNEKEFFEKILPGKVYLVEHGIDTGFFFPDASVEKTKSCVFAGNWLRNIPLLVEVVTLITSQRKDIHFNIINQHVDNKNHPLYALNSNKNVSLFKNLSDEELRNVYRSSSIAVLPLKDSTANNGLMETAACGLPVVVTEVGGVRCYTNSSFCIYVPQEATARVFAEKVIALIDDIDAVNKMGANATAYMHNNFNWQLIADKTYMLYKSLL